VLSWFIYLVLFYFRQPILFNITIRIIRTAGTERLLIIEFSKNFLRLVINLPQLVLYIKKIFYGVFRVLILWQEWKLYIKLYVFKNLNDVFDVVRVWEIFLDLLPKMANFFV
jgi:hypothetical protein